MNNLILDCSCGMNIYLQKGEEIFLFEDKIQNKHSDEVLKNIDDLLNKASLKVSDIKNFCVCVGPGSFTGVRVAVSVVKGLAIGVCADVYALTNFDIFFDGIENSVLILDGFSNFVYVRKRQNGAVRDFCIEIDKIVNEIELENLKVYHTTEKMQNLLKKYGIDSEFVKSDIVSSFNKKIERSEKTELNMILPVYLRASQAEIEREKKKNG